MPLPYGDAVCPFGLDSVVFADFLDVDGVEKTFRGVVVHITLLDEIVVLFDDSTTEKYPVNDWHELRATAEKKASFVNPP